LLIAEPGSGDLHLDRVGALFAWCAGCNRLVGRSCCWVAGADVCADCAVAVAEPNSELTDAALGDAALSAIATATRSLAETEGTLRRVSLRDAEGARNAWEDAWLEAGALTARADSAARVVRRRAAPTPDAPIDRLAALGTGWLAGRRAMDDRLQRVGLRIRALDDVAAPPDTLPTEGRSSGAPAPHASGGGVTALAPSRTPVRTERRAAPPSGSLQPVAIRRAEAGMPAVKAMDEATPASAAAVAVPDEATAAPEIPTEAHRAGRPRLVVVTVAALALFAASVAVATVERERGSVQSGPGPASEGAVSGGADGDVGPRPSASVQPASTGGAANASVESLTFDAEPLGRITADADGVARVLGSPEVAAVPTSFDRSLRLDRAGDGACLAGPAGSGPLRALAVNVLTPAPAGVEVLIVPMDRPDRGVRLALGEIPGLGPDAWYRVRVAWAEDGAIRLVVLPADGGPALHRSDLEPSPGPDRGGAGSACIEATAATEAASVHLDRVRVER
jgi:hypothetical protein